MSVTRYDYIKQANVHKLTQEITSSDIVIQLDHIDMFGLNDLRIFMKYALSPGDEAILDQIVEDHDGLPDANQTNPVDEDNAPYFRIKVAPEGWTYQHHTFEVHTSMLDSIYEEDYDGTDRNFTVLKFYDVNGNEITDQPTLDTDCVETVIDWMPTYDYALVGGSADTYDNLSSDVRLYVVAVPDIPAPTGSKVMINGANFRYMSNKEILVDGKAAKHMSYDAVYATNKLRFIIKHGAGEKFNFALTCSFYKL